jgi:hypothetical protein
MIQQFHMGQFHSYPFVRDHKFCIRDVTWGHLQKYSKKILQHARALIWMKHYQSTPTRWIIISQLLVRCLKLQSLLKSSSPVLFSLVFCEFCDHSEIIFSTKHTHLKAMQPGHTKCGWMNGWPYLPQLSLLLSETTYVIMSCLKTLPIELVVLVWILSDWDSFMRLVVCVERCLLGCNITKSMSGDDYSYLLMILELSMK